MMPEDNEAPEAENPSDDLPGPEDRELTPLEEDIRLVLKSVYDPEVPVDIYDLGLVYNFCVNCEGKVDVKMTLTSPACPAGPQIIQQAKMALESLDDVDEAQITLVMTPPWSPERMTDEARDHLGIF